jgi:hypothetical protein
MSISSSFWNWEPDVVFGKCPTVPGEVLALVGHGRMFVADEGCRNPSFGFVTKAKGL